MWYNLCVGQAEVQEEGSGKLRTCPPFIDARDKSLSAIKFGLAQISRGAAQGNYSMNQMNSF